MTRQFIAFLVAMVVSGAVAFFLHALNVADLFCVILGVAAGLAASVVIMDGTK